MCHGPRMMRWLGAVRILLKDYKTWVRDTWARRRNGKATRFAPRIRWRRRTEPCWNFAWNATPDAPRRAHIAGRKSCPQIGKVAT